MTAPAAPPPAGHPSPAERAARGRDARRTAPRGAHGDWAPAPGRPDPVAVLEEQGATRVPELLPIRYGRMLQSPFAFFRGAAAIMAGDLAGTPDTGITVQLCGDAHLSNFGIYAAPDRRLVFDLNDFDETHAGPWEWDLKRLVASLEVAARDRDFGSAWRRRIVLAGARGYREAMRSFAAMGHLAVWYARFDVAAFLADAEAELSRDEREAARRMTDKARGRTSLRALRKLTTTVDGRLRFASQPPLLMRLEDLLDAGAVPGDLEAALDALLDAYRASLSPELRHLVGAYRPVDIARKVVGVGSVGTRAWIVLLEGSDERDPLVLQAKEAGASVLERHLGPSPYANHGERVVQGQRWMQADGDLLLGWQRVTGVDGQERDFYVRQLWDGKWSAAIDAMAPERMRGYARLCGWMLARAHARTGDRVAIAAYLGGGDRFDRALAAFAEAYAEQNAADHAALGRAVADGRLAAQPGV